ncbi:Bug family tripartite tricarboxylate transporter substrate binding protein [Ramlibacter sp. MAHUQ-53]|uniref:Bug family tripartite tricarboxylate transporter substrate binding protein n=1 Tax=unclassified Ramlibacter TaxID=2617605 RepID=UPI00363815D3
MTRLPTRRQALGLGAASLAGLASLPAFAQAAPWRPDKPVRLLVGFAPGGSSDTVARLLAPKLGEALGQPVVVENRAGAGGALAAEAVAKAPGDGTTWLLAPSGHSTMAAMRKSLPFRAVADFAWTSTVTTYPMVMAVPPNSPIRSMADVIEAARKRPLSFSSVGVGTAHHLLGEWINAEQGIQMLHVPFKGGTAAATEVMAGRVDVLIETMTAALPFVQQGQLRAVAVSSASPVALLPGVPTMGATIPSLQYESWLGVALPGTTPAPVVNAVNAAIRGALADPAIAKRLADLGGGAAPSTPEAFKARVEGEVARFNRVVDSRRIERE